MPSLDRAVFPLAGYRISEARPEGKKITGAAIGGEKSSPRQNELQNKIDSIREADCSYVWVTSRNGQFRLTQISPEWLHSATLFLVFLAHYGLKWVKLIE